MGQTRETECEVIQVYEVDYLWVGEKTDTGDAIAMRFTETDALRVVVIDGGNAETGARMVEHVRERYKTEVVDLVVCTHPDDDHIMGLFTVIEELTVRRLLIHRPSRYGYSADDGVKSTRVEDLVRLARARGVTIDDSYYAGTSYFGHALTIAGPSEQYYIQLLDEQSSAETKTLAKLSHAGSSVMAKVAHAVRTLFGDPGETMVDDNGGTTPRNNSSIILNLEVDGKRVLFTGDAGAPALEQAADRLDAWGKSAREVDLFDVPHHGSRHNLTPQLLDRLLGPHTNATRGLAIASVGAEAWDHPRPEVANAIKRRGYPVYVTRGVNLLWSSPDAPPRLDYTKSQSALDWLDESSSGEGSGAA